MKVEWKVQDLWHFMSTSSDHLINNFKTTVDFQSVPYSFFQFQNCSYVFNFTYISSLWKLERLLLWFNCCFQAVNMSKSDKMLLPFQVKENFFVVWEDDKGKEYIFHWKNCLFFHDVMHSGESVQQCIQNLKYCFHYRRSILQILQPSGQFWYYFLESIMYSLWSLKIKVISVSNLKFELCSFSFPKTKTSVTQIVSLQPANPTKITLLKYYAQIKSSSLISIAA